MDPSRRSEPPGRAGDPEAQSPEYSTLFLVWPEADAPLQEEVRLALQATYGGVQAIDELDAGDDLLWGVTWRIPADDDRPEADYLVWAEPRGDLGDDFLRQALGAGAEYAAAKASRWLIGVEARLSLRRPQASFQDQLRFVREVAVPGLVAVYDDNALIIRSGREIEDLCACDVPPRASTLYAVHVVEGTGGMWLHTHGLLRAGLPDLDLVGIPSQFADDAHELLHAIVDRLLAGDDPEPSGRLELGTGLELRLLPLGDALGLFPPNIAGGSNDRSGDMADHGGDRLIVLDVRRDLTPLDALVQVSGDGTLYKSRGETERQRSLSVSRWGTFGQLFAINRRGTDWSFHVKLAYDQRVPGKREHLWFEVLGLQPGRVHGRLMNHPLDVPDLRAGQELWQPLERLTDWLIVTPHGSFDPEVAPVLLQEPS
ncbi:MAG: DUF4026 domain-containing protein [Planctomycetes bacterium]|nr:DUF4026 domain-containing protein [Planctomycetota bacterium]